MKVRRRRRKVAKSAERKPEVKYPCKWCGKPRATKPDSVCSICFFVGAPKKSVERLDVEKLKAMLRKEGIPIDEILRKDARAFRRALQRR